MSLYQTLIMVVKHLEFAKQGYFEHMRDAWFFSAASLTASFCFFIHGLIPDAFSFTGSALIQSLNRRIEEKYAYIREQSKQNAV